MMPKTVARPVALLLDAARGSGRQVQVVAVVLALSASASAAGAQSETSPPPVDPSGVLGSIADPAQQSSDPNRQLRDLESTLTESETKTRRLQADIEQARTDRLRFNAALIETTAHVRDAESKLAETGVRLDALTGSEEAIRKSLESRRGVIADVLAALQRMGHRPPPAMLVRPDEILKTIRSSILLGAVLPEMREQAETLAADLTELQRVRHAITDERATMTADAASLGSESERLRGLIDARQKAQAEAEASLGQESARTAELARQATSLKDFIARLENGVASARKAADAARAAEDGQKKEALADSQAVEQKVAAGIFHDPARLQPAVPFGETKGLLPLPLTGRAVKTFGQPDGFGGTEKGLSLVARAGAIVTSPADGWVAFSGRYRTYGQVLILNLGGGYYSVFAGMEHVDAVPGQFVLAGEPVGVMGDGSVKTASAISLGASDPVLYVELRKDGIAIDPSPWWAKAALEKVRG